MSHQVQHTPTSDVLTLASGLADLQESPEFRGPVEPLDDDQHCNEHLALIHESSAEQFAAAVPYVRQGLDRGERVLYVVDDNSEAAVAGALREAGVGVDAAVASGQLSFHGVAETYLRDGTFDPEGMLEFYTEAIEAATEEYAGLRVAAECAWVADDSTDFESWLEYESRVNDLFEGEDCIALCQYDRRLHDPAVIRDLIRTHPHLVYENVVCHNFYYTPPGEFLDADEPDREVDRMMNTLVERTVARTELQEQQTYLRRHTEITSDPSRSFEEKLEALFGLGRDRFDLELGAMARVDTGADRFEVEYASGDHDRFEPGLELPLSETYCTAATDVESVGSVSDPEAAGYDHVAVYREFDVRAYVGTHIPIDRGDDRTFFFVSSDRREEPFSDDERTFVQLMGQWIQQELERERHEERLSALNELNQAFQRVETVEAVTDCLVDDATRLGMPSTAVGIYDAESGRLLPDAATDGGQELLDRLSPFSVGDGVAWGAFLDGETRRHGVGAPANGSGPSTNGSGGSADNESNVVAVPLCDHGVLVTELGPGGDDGDVDFVETVAANATAALDRTTREQELQARERDLAAQNEALTRLDRVNTIIRNIDQALVGATSRSEIHAVACEELTDAGPYEFAWVGTRDPGSGGLEPTERAGDDTGFLEAVSDDSGLCPLASRAATAREVRFENELISDAASETWRQEALNRGYHAAIALPLVYRDTMFGVLALYADQPGVFDDMERTVLAELSDTVAHAINAVEHKRSLVSTDVTELTFVLPETAFGFGRLGRTLDCTFVHEGFVSTDDELRWYFETDGAAAEEVVSLASDLPATDVEPVAEHDDGRCQFEATVTGRALPADVLEHGGRVDELHAEDGTATVTVHLAGDADTREFVETFGRSYEGAELVAKRRRSRDRQTSAEFRSVLTEDLTDRQREALRTAFFSGYFEQPRVRTGQDIAETMDISQPTFTSHLRNAERKIYSELFEDDE